MSERKIVVWGLEIGDVPKEWTPIDVLAVVESVVEMDDSTSGPSAMRLSIRATDSMTIWKAMGMLKAVMADLESQFVETLGDSGEEDT
jgi:hypothetical protein